MKATLFVPLSAIFLAALGTAKAQSNPDQEWPTSASSAETTASLSQSTQSTSLWSNSTTTASSASLTWETTQSWNYWPASTTSSVSTVPASWSSTSDSATSSVGPSYTAISSMTTIPATWSSYTTTSASASQYTGAAGNIVVDIVKVGGLAGIGALLML